MSSVALRLLSSPRRKQHGRMTLLRLLGRFLRPHGRPIALIVLFQLIQSVASLYLPTLNADIID